MVQSSQSIRDQLKRLETLQELDLKIDGLKQKKQIIPQTLRTHDLEIQKIQAQLTLKENVVNEIEKIIRQTKAAAELNDDRMKRASSKLEQVQNGPEYQAAVKEIDQLKRYASSLQEQLKKAEADAAAARSEAEVIIKTMSEKKQVRDLQASELGGQGIELDHKLDGLLGQRKDLTVGVERRILSIYDRVRTARAGLGLVPAVLGRCKGCNMVVPPQLYNEVQKSKDVHSCPSCNRLLFIPEMGNGIAAQGNSS